MTTYKRRLYTVVLRAEAQEQTEQSLSRTLDLQGLLDGGSSATAVAADPDQISVNATVVGSQAGKIATELEELATANGFDTVPFFVKGSDTSDKDGYYTLESIDDTPGATWAADSARQLRVAMRRDGTHETRWIGVETTPIQVDHEYGNDTTPKIAIPDTATKRRWYDGPTGTVESAGTPLSIDPTEHGDVAVYDVDAGETAVGTDGADRGPTLLFELDYADAGVVDPVVWDTLGHASKLDSDGIRQWQHVFATSHEFAGKPVLDSGRLRVFVQESSGDLAAETWDDANTTWSSVGLDWSTTDWELFDWDVEAITPTAMRSYAIFEHPTDGFYTLNAALERGRSNVRWSVPTNESSPIPSALESTLEPIASHEVVDAQPVRELVRRSEVK